MICKECQDKKYKRMLAEADKAMKRYTAKLKEESKKYAKQKQNKG